MNDEENIWYQKQIAIEGLRSNISTALGIGLLAVGASFGIAGIGTPGTHPDIFVISLGFGLIGFGTAIVLISYGHSKKIICDLKYSPTTSACVHITTSIPESTTSSSNVQSETVYTGKRYFKTRKQLSFHPEDKRFRD